MNAEQQAWTGKYNYREATAVDSCDLCAYAIRIDTDHDLRVEALSCDACGDDTGAPFNVDFGFICDLFLPELLEEEPEK